jgi:small subunit ribosomal protein S18
VERNSAAPQVEVNISTKKVFFRRRSRGCPLSEAGAPEIDYKNIRTLLKFLSDRGRILPSRITSVRADKQRKLKKAIKRARILGLIPFVKKY